MMDKHDLLETVNTQVVLYELPTVTYQQPQRNESGSWEEIIITK